MMSVIVGYVAANDAAIAVPTAANQEITPK
jgi:hypothetical protein